MTGMKELYLILLNIILIFISYKATYYYKMNDFTWDKVLWFVFIITFITSIIWSIHLAKWKVFKKYLLFIIFWIVIFPISYYLTYNISWKHIYDTEMYLGWLLFLFYWLIYLIIKYILKFIIWKIKKLV
jgi:hypothetical protein